MANESTKWLYDQLKGKGYNVGKDVNEFDSLMRSNADSRKWAYETVTKSGLNVGKDIDEFSNLVGGTQAAVPSTTPVTPVEDVKPEKQTVQPKQQQAWRSTPLHQVRMSADIDAVMDDFNKGTTASLDRARRVAERMTPEGQKKLKRAETHARLNGLPTRVTGINPGASAPEQEHGSDDIQEATQRMLSGQGPKPYGVKMVDGEPVTQWLMPDGSLTTDIMEADKAEYGARNVRLMNEFTGRMKRNGLDPARQEDVETQRQKDHMSNLTSSGQLRQAIREQERLDELMRRRREEIETEVNARPGLAFLRGMADESHGMAGSLVNDNGMKDYRLDDEYRQLESAARKNRQRIQTLTDMRNDRMDSFWHSLGATFTNGYTLTDGMAEMNDAIALMSAKKHVPEINRKRKAGEALTRDEEAAEAVLSNTLIDDEVQGTIGQEYGAWARAGSMFSMSLDLMKDIMLTPGAGTIAKGIASGVSKGLGRGVSKAVARVAGEKAAEKAAENLATRFLTKATGVLIGAHAAGAVISNTAGIGHTLGETATGVAGKVAQDGNGYAFTDEKRMLEALYDAERNQIRENGSEMFGEFIPGVGGLVTKGLEKIGLKKVSEQLTKIGSKDWYKQYSSLLESGGYNGLPGEAIEEYEGYLFDILTGHGGEAMKELADKNTHIDIWLGCATTGALLGAVPMVMHGGHTAMYYKYKHAAAKSDGVASTVIGDRWEAIRDRIDDTPNEHMADALTDILVNENLGERETTAMMDYVRNLAKMRGYNLAQIASVEDGEEMSPEEADAEESFRDGYSATTPQEMNDAKSMLDLQRKRLASSLSDDMVREYDEDPIGTLSRTADPELRRIAADYVNAKQLYDGMIQRVRDDIDGSVAQSDAEIESRVNRQTGMIHPATMKVDDRPVYVVNGTVSMYEDGTGVDAENSSESIIIRDAETGKIEFADPTQVLNVGEGIDAESEKEAARNKITREIAQAATYNIDGVISFAPGESYNILDINGKQDSITVLGQTADENGMPLDGYVDIQYQEGVIRTVATTDLQQWVDGANEQRVTQFADERVAERAAADEAERQADETGLSNPNRDRGLLPDNWEMPYYGFNTTASRYIESEKGTGAMLYRDVNGNDAIVVAAIDDNNYVGYFREYDEHGNPTNRWSAKFNNESGLRENHRDMMQTAQELLPAGHELTEHTSISTDGLRNLANQLKHGYELQYDKQGNVITSEVMINMMARKNELGLAEYEPGDNNPARVSAEEYKKAASRLIPYMEALGLSKFNIHWENGYLYVDHPVLRRADTPRQEAEAGVLKSDEDVLNSGENAEIEGQSVSKTASNGNDVIDIPSTDAAKVEAILAPEQPQPSALSQIPTDKKGDPIYEQAEPGTAWDALLEETEDEQIAQNVIAQEISEREDALKKLEKQKPKAGLSTREKIQAEKDKKKAMDDIRKSIDHWKSMSATKQRRQAEVDAIRNEESRRRAEERRAQEEQARAEREKAERKDAEEERLWEERKSRIDKRLRATAEKYRDIPEVVELLGHMEPMSADEVAAYLLSRYKVLWKSEVGASGMIVKAGVGYHAGIGEAERRKLIGLFASEAKGGMSIERLAGDLFKEVCEEYGIPYDNQEALNELIDMIRGSGTMGVIRSYIADKRVEQAERMGEHVRSQEEEMDEQFHQETYGMSRREYEAYEEQLSEQAREFFKDIDETEFFSNFADEIERQTQEDEYRRDKAHVAAGEGEDGGGGGEVLPEPQAAKAGRGDGAPGEETRGGVGDRATEHDQDGGLSEGASRRADSTGLNGGAEASAQGQIISLEASRPDTGGATGDEVQASDERGGESEPAIDQAPSLGERISEAEAVVNTEPTEAQKEAGNYRKGHVQVGSFDVTIENPKGSVRRGKDVGGKQWETTMTHTYGYIRGTKGVDGDHIDVYISSEVDDWNGRNAFVVDQYNPDGSFDEHKVMLGFNDRDEAFAAYLSNYESGWEKGRRLDITAVPIDEFEKWIESSKRKTKPFADYKSVKTDENATAHEGKDELHDEVRQWLGMKGLEPTDASRSAVMRYFKIGYNRAGKILNAIAEEIAATQEDTAATSGEGYTIVSKPYTNKQGKTLDTHLVTFDRDFSKEEQKRIRSMAKDKKGWQDRETGGYMLRSREDAEAFAASVMAINATSTADAPVSISDIESAIKPAETEISTSETEISSPETDKTGTETEISSPADNTTDTKPDKKKSKWVDDEDAAEFERLRKIMRDGLGQLNMGFPPELLYAGAKMSYLMMKHGVRKFAEYAAAMIEELGDAIRPHLKALYNFTRSTDEVTSSEWANELTPFDEVMGFDTANFDKNDIDAMATAENVVVEENSRQHMEETVKGLAEAQRKNKKKPGQRLTTEQSDLFGNEEERIINDVIEETTPPEPKPEAELSGDSAEYQERTRQERDLVDDIVIEIMKRTDMKERGEDRGALTMRDIRGMLENYNLLTDISATDLQELVERAMTILTRTAAKTNQSDPRKGYDRVVGYYNMQPSLNARDSERLIKQQYSTPTPFGYVMGQFVNAKNDVKSVLEPSAGNGALTIMFDPATVHVNDIDERRLENLRTLGYGTVTAQNGLLPFEGVQVDGVLTNPPFGTVAEKVYDGVFKISSLEGQMAINALDSMKDGGRAAIIIGGNTSYRTNGSMNPKDAAFFGYLYSHYNVVDVINISGKALYARNGTGYDVRMILINGRKTGEFSRVYPPVKSKARAEQVTTFDELYKRVQDDIQQVFQMGHKPADVQPEAGSTADGGTGAPVRSGNNSPNKRTGQQPGTTGNGSGSASGSHIGQPSSGNAGSRPNGLDNGDGGNAGGADDVQRPKPATSGSNGSGSAQNDTGGSGSNGRGAASSRPNSGGERLAVKPDLNTEKVPYPNQSENGFTLLSVVPAAQAEVLQRSLGEIGDVDQFLVDELGYSSKEELYGFLAAEQIDSVALAIHQMNKGNAFIIGDMTGVGKGRQGAALIRYGVRQGRCPIYFTQKPTLFTDNYRDLADIGSSELRPFIIASNPKDANIVDANGKVVHKLPSKKEQERVFNYIMQNGKLPKEYDYVLTTYDQIKNGTADYSQNEDGTWNTEARKLPKKSKGYTTADYNGQARRDALARLAMGVAPGQGNIAILDESHTVGGDSGCGRYMQMLTSGAYGVTFLSATFAKRADNMPIYAQRTAIAEAGVKANELIEAIVKGGVTLQEIMSKQLVESGQMIRRERSFEGVTIDWLSVEEETDRKQREQFNEVANIFNSIRNFQNDFIKPIIDRMNEAAAEQGATVGQTQGTKDLGVRNTPFASKMYNLVNQLLFALKVDAVADRVIENLRNGFKPVISFTNTMEGFLASAPKGVAMDEVPNFSLTLMRALDGVMRFTENDADQNSEGGQITLSQLSPEGQKAYNEVKEKIMNLSADLPISPMDAIRMKIEEAGYSVAEITGRTTQLNRTEDGRYIVEGRKDRDKKAAMRDFNAGKLDVLMINKSGSTGISLHASSKFDDQRQRVMVFAQFQSDINDEVQMRGRIDRSGQVVRGRYEYIMSTIPAEQRIQMMFKAKLKSLDANTTSSQKSKFNEMEIVDYLNKYGDEVVWEYMKEHPELSDRLGDPLKMLQDKGDDESARTSENEDTSQKSDCAGKISRYLAFLSVEEQDEIFKEITEAYKVKIQLLDDAGENDLEITTMPLRAETKSRQIWHRGENPGSGNAFADNTYVEEVEVDVLKKPMKRSEIEDMTRKLMGDKVATATAYDQQRYGMKDGELNWGRYADTMIQEINSFFSAKTDDAVEKMKEAGEKRVAKARDKAVKDALKAQAKGENTFSDQEIESLADVVAKEAQDREEIKQYRRREEINNVRDHIKHLFSRLRAGHIYVVPQDLKQATADMFTQTFGTFVGFKFNKSYTLGSSTAIFATLDGRRKVELALNDKAIDTIIRCTDTALRYSPKEINAISMDNWDSKVPTQTRQKRYIITGNLLQALVDTEKGERTKGNLISFSTMEGDTQQGILMRENFKPTDLRSSVPLRSRLKQIQDGMTVVSENGDVQIERVDFDWKHRGEYELRVPKSKQRGGIYSMHPELLKLIDGHNFNSKGNSMVGYVLPENIAKVVDMLSRAPFNLTVLEESKLTETNDENGIRYRDGDEDANEMPVAEAGAYEKGGRYGGSLFDFDNGEMDGRSRMRFGRQQELDFSSPDTFDRSGTEAPARDQIDISHPETNPAERTEEVAALRNENAVEEAEVRVREVNGRIDDFVEKAKEIYDRYGLFAQMRPELSEGLLERMDAELMTEADRLRGHLEEYYHSEGNSAEDCRRMARDMAGRVIAETTLRLAPEVRAAIGIERQQRVPAEADKEQMVTAGGEVVTFKTSEADGNSSLKLETGTKTSSGTAGTAQENKGSKNGELHVAPLRKLEPGEYTHVERQFTMTGEFGFTGNERIESLDDIAYIFRSLEDFSIENTFAVLVKDGHPTIVHLGMGGPAMSPVDMAALRGAVDAFGADEVYFVHNHPSGTLRPSPEDRRIHRQLREMLGDDMAGESIIIDVTSGRYCTFDEAGSESHTREDGNHPETNPAKGIHAEREYGVVRQNRTRRTAEGKDVGSLPVIRSSGDVASIVAEKRLDGGSKISYLLLAHNNAVIGNLHTAYRSYGEDVDGLANEMVRMGVRHGASRVIPYGNVKLTGEDLSHLSKTVKRLSGGTVNVLDALQIDSRLGDGYRSAMDEGLMAYEPDGNWQESVDELNERFNDDLRKFEKGELDEKYRFELGMPSRYLLSAGFPELPISMRQSLLSKKAAMERHKFSPLSLSNLVEAIQKPLAIFEYSKPNMRNLIVDLTEGGKHFLVGVTLNYKAGEIEINSVSGLFPKDNAEWLKWIQGHKAIRIDGKEKIQAIIDSQRTTNTVESERIGLNFESVAKIVKNFENPPLPDEKRLERRGDVDAGLSSGKDPWMLPWGESMRQDRRRKEEAGRLREAMRGRVTALAEALGVEIDIIADGSEDHLATNWLMPAKRRAKGWYDTATGKITVVVGNHRTVEDVEATVLHEAVAHYGLRRLLGGRFDRFLDTIYENADDKIKEQIDLLAIKNDWNRRVATEEYLASLAEGTDFEKMDSKWWSRIKELFMDFLRRCGFSRKIRLGDNELRSILWMSWKNLRNPGALDSFLGLAERVAKEDELGLWERSGADAPAQGRIDNGEHPETNPEDSEADGVRFRDGDFTPRDRVLARDWYEKMLGRGSWQFREAVQDSMLGLKTLYEAILTEGDKRKRKDFRIEDVAGYENAYLYENRMSSANNGEQHQYFIRHMKPLLESVHVLCGSDERQRRMLTDYMMAKHGLERNTYMRNEAAAAGENTDRDFAGLCGLTGETDWAAAEAAAQKMVDDYERDHDTTELWDNVKRATTATLEKIYLSGMISEDTFNKVLGMYDHYIPLRGWDETTSDEVYGYLTSKDGPLMGNVFKAAKGRGSKADDPIAFIAQMADDAIRQGNRNIMKQRFLNFVHGNPSDLVSVTELWLQYNDAKDEWEPVFADLKPDMTPAEVESEIAKFEAKMEQLIAKEPKKYKRGRDAGNIHYLVKKENLREHQVLVKRNGRTYVMTINGNPRAAQALNGLTNPDVEMGGVIGDMLKGAEYINRNLSAFYTTRNPDFVVSNFLRDMFYSNCMTWVKENPRYALRFHKNYGKVNPIRLHALLSKWESGTLSDGNNQEKMFKEFMLNGCETGYTSVRDIEAHKRAIAAELKKQGSVARKAWAALGGQLDMLNRSVENCARFAAYVTSREMGRSIDRSIHDAKEVSVNFNKKGSGGKFVNATGQTRMGKIGAYLGGTGRIAYVFWNAGVQGMTNFGRAARRHPAKAIAGASALFAMGTVIPLLAQLMGGGGDDDDKNAYYNLPEYVRRSNICFKAGDQWITIPLPIEYRAIYGLGELATGVISGNERYSNTELAMQMAGQVSQIMPLDMLEGGGGISPFIPSAVKPFTEAYIMNKGWTGLPVYKDTPYNKNDPEWTKAYQSAEQHLVSFAKWLNETTRGDDYKKGYIDINPAKLEYLLNGTFGGVVSFPLKMLKAGETMFGSREFEWRNMPLVNRVVKSGDERTANRKLQNEYYKYKNEAEETNRLRKKYEKAAYGGILEYAEKVDFLYNSPEYLRYEIFGEFQPDMDAISEEIKTQTDPEAKKELQAELYATMRELVDALNNPDEYFKSKTEVENGIEAQ